MKSIQEETIDDLTTFFRNKALEGHLFGSFARGTNDALSDIDIWLTFDNVKIQEVIKDRFEIYAKFGEVLLLHEMQNNFPLDGIQTAIIYKINDELIRIDFYLCPMSSSRILPGSKILFENIKIKEGEIIPETKRTPRDLLDRITFLISMCFNGIKKVIRKDQSFIDFLISEFKKNEKEIPSLSAISANLSLHTLKDALAILYTVSNEEQRKAIVEINLFMSKLV